MEYEMLDAPFFNMLEKFGRIQSYFTVVAWDIARIVIILCLGFMFLKHAMTGEGLKDNLVKFLLTFVVYGVVIANYPGIVSGINKLIYEFSVNSTYKAAGERVASLQEYAQKVREEHIAALQAGVDGMDESVDAGWYDRASLREQASARADAAVKLAEAKEAAEKESLDLAALIKDDLFEEQTNYIRPTGMGNLIILVCTEIWGSSPRGIDNIGQTILDLLCMAAVVLCGIFGSIQYFVGALEFSLITAVGIICIPFMLWDGTKFITEKLVGALIGFFLKMLFLTICLLFMYYGFLELTLQPYEGAIDQLVYFVFSAMFYMMITQNGPKLALTLLTGTPQMSIMEVAQAAGAYGGAALAAKKAGGATAKTAAGGALKTGFAVAGTHARAKGAAEFVKSEGGDKKEQAAAYRASVGASMKEGMAGRASTAGRSLMSGGGGRGGGAPSGGGGTKGYNRYSQTERFNQANEKGQNLTMREHLGKQNAMGQEDGLNYMIKREELARKMNSPDQGRSLAGGGAPERAENVKPAENPQGRYGRQRRGGGERRRRR